MLEFQEEFFQQEVREGFYIDTTMKTVWAAELEVLQVIAEVCDRHGLTWFAGFGTLLGAVRHGGFIPWDDDMDILMLRDDYMKLMRVLPQEVPEGFRVRSPFSEEGYTEYHCAVINGSGVSIEPGFLERFHGCPFTVGLDIFPLDFLPRNKKERQVQKELFTLAGRCVQLAKNLTDEDVLKPECDLGKTDQQFRKELREGLKALESYCRVRFDKKAVKEERWEELITPLWKLANQIAMMYKENESDYLVMYGDYITWERKMYPKEWFAELVGFPFEDFMVPGPKEYDAVLTVVYKNYLIPVRKGGMHEYPYYKRQLVQLREYVKNVEDKARLLGLQVDGDARTESDPVPAQLERLGIRPGEKSRKIMLFANDILTFANYGNRALDKLEEVLHTFYGEREHIVLWWRPQTKMQEILDQVEPALGTRYREIMNRYLSGAWGIWDDTDNTDRAVEMCDAYYGDLNQILQPFQAEGKLILIADYEV